MRVVASLATTAMPEADATNRAKVRYLRDCFEHEVGTVGLLDVEAAKVDRRIVFDGEEHVLSGTLDAIPLPGTAGRELAGAAYLSRREKDLVYACCFVAGGGCCAPLLLYPATTEEHDGVPFLVPRRDAPRPNLDLVDHLLAGLPEAERPARREAFLAALDLERIGPLEVAVIAEQLARLAPPVASEAVTWPHLVDAKAVTTARLAPSPRLLPAAAALLLVLPRVTRGMRDELRTLAQGGPYGGALRAILAGARRSEAKPEPDVAPIVPALLSAAQQRALRRARTSELSVIVGPPGTGKTFTIANLALDRLAAGGTVLVASRRDDAVDVIVRATHRLVNMTGVMTRAGGDHQARHALSGELESLIAGTPPGYLQSAPAGFDVVLPNVDRILGSPEALSERIAQLESSLDDLSRLEQRIGDLLAAEDRGFLDGLRLRWHRLLRSRSRGRGLAAILDEIDQLERTRRLMAIARIRKVRRERALGLLERRRRELQRFARSLRSRSAHHQSKHLEGVDLGEMLEAFPLLAVTFGQLAETLPMVPDRFDLGIIDEASQCDLATALPMLQRCHRVVVVGDPKQLRHISFLGRAEMARLATRHCLDELELDGLDFRRRSLIDRALESVASQDDVSFLDEHYRGLPDLIAFSNHRYYGGALKVMRGDPRRSGIDATELVRVDGERDPDTGSNEVEAEAVVDAITQLLAEESGPTAGRKRSIGVIAPFRAQVDLLQKLIQRRLRWSDLTDHKLLVGTPYAFQGAERDVVLVSLAVSDPTRRGALRHLCRDDVFNVMITRARSRQLVFCSLDHHQLDQASPLAAYLHEIAGAPDAVAAAADEDGHRFLDEVMAACRGRGWSCHPRYPMAGLVVDLIVADGGRQLAVDLVGGLGSTGACYPPERYRMFRRAGLPMRPLTREDWEQQREEELDAIATALADGHGDPED